MCDKASKFNDVTRTGMPDIVCYEMSEIPRCAEKGTYVLIVNVASRKELTIGRLGTFVMAPGYYAYVGSALGPGGLRARLGHHIRAAGRPRWHIDYLRRISTPVEVWTAASNRRLESAWAAALSGMRSLVPVIDGFGASDCGCNTHLFYSKRLPSVREFRGRVGGKVKRCSLIPR